MEDKDQFFMHKIGQLFWGKYTPNSYTPESIYRQVFELKKKEQKQHTKLLKLKAYINS